MGYSEAAREHGRTERHRVDELAELRVLLDRWMVQLEELNLKRAAILVREPGIGPRKRRLPEASQKFCELLERLARRFGVEEPAPASADPTHVLEVVFALQARVFSVAAGSPLPPLEEEEEEMLHEATA